MTLFLLVTKNGGETERIEVARIGSDETRQQITSAIAAHADLEYVRDNQPGLNAEEVAWRKRSAAAAAPAMASTEPALAAPAAGPTEPSSEPPAARAPGAAYDEAIAAYDAAIPETSGTAPLGIAA